MSKKHYEKIMSKRGKRTQIVADMLDQLDTNIAGKLTPIYMDSSGTIDWNRLAEHVREATSGR
jgi:predicted transcriptional regulator